MTIRDTLSPEDRAELDALLQELPPSDRALLRLVELFMTHQLAQAGILNAEVRSILARQGAALEGHERAVAETCAACGARLSRLEQRADIVDAVVLRDPLSPY